MLKPNRLGVPSDYGPNEIPQKKHKQTCCIYRIYAAEWQQKSAHAPQNDIHERKNIATFVIQRFTFCIGTKSRKIYTAILGEKRKNPIYLLIFTTTENQIVFFFFLVDQVNSACTRALAHTATAHITYDMI